MIRLAFVLTVSVIAGGAAIAADPPAHGKYYPTAIGGTWHYEVAGQVISTKVTKEEKVGDLNGVEVETTANGVVAGREAIAITKDGIVRASLNGQKADPPVLIWKAGAKPGDKWAVKTKVGTETIEGEFVAGAEEVTVPAGKYKAVTAFGEFKANGMEVKFKFWFAENVGMVKTVVSLGGMDVSIELKKYEPAK